MINLKLKLLDNGILFIVIKNGVKKGEILRFLRTVEN